MANIEERKSKTGIKSYRVKVRLKGKPLETATFKRLTDAKKWAADTESAIRQGRYFKTSESKKHTFAEMIDRYIKTVLPQKPKSYKIQKMQLEWWKQHLGTYILSDITPALITIYRDKLQTEPYGSKKDRYRGAATTVRYMAALSHCFTIAVNDWGWLDDSPLKKVRKPKEPRGRVRFLNDEELKSLLDACKASDNKLLYTLVVLAISTGLRRSELLNLTWNDIDLSKGTARILETKNGDRRTVPIKGRALELLKNLHSNKGIDNNLLFPKNKAPQKPMPIRWFFIMAVEQAELKDFKYHDLRHCAASYLAMNGATPVEIAEVLGHKTLVMVKRYAHLAEQHTADIVEKMNRKVFG